jgi:hypothetical protein
MMFRTIALSLVLGWGCVSTDDFIHGDDGTLPLSACATARTACMATCDILIRCPQKKVGDTADR